MAITYRGHAVGGGSGTAGTVQATGTFSSNPVAGDTIHVDVFGEADTSGNIGNCTITDSAGNTYTACGALQGTGSRKGRSWYAKNVSVTAGMVVTATNADLMNGYTVFARAFAGADTSAPLDQYGGGTVAAPGTGANALTSAAVTPTVADTIVLSAFTSGTGLDTITAGTNYTKSTDSADIGASAEYRILSGGSGASQTPAYTVDPGSATFVVLTANYKPASGSTYTLTCTQQTYAITGNATGLLAGRTVTATQQTYTLTGVAVTLTYTPSGARTLTCDSQTYTLTGIAVSLDPQSPPAQYVLTGIDVGLLASTRVLTCDQQTYTLTGVAVPFLTTHVMTCVTASYLLNGTATNLVYSNAPASSGAGTDSVRRFLRPYLSVKRRLAAYT